MPRRTSTIWRALPRPIRRAALMMALCLFSLIGMPLTVGFLGKFYLIQTALTTGHTALAIIMVLNAAVAAAYYLKIIAAMYLREPLYPFAVRTSLPIRVTAVLCTVGVVAFFIAPRPLFEANNTLFDQETKKAQVEACRPYPRYCQNWINDFPIAVSVAGLPRVVPLVHRQHSLNSPYTAYHFTACPPTLWRRSSSSSSAKSAGSGASRIMRVNSAGCTNCRRNVCTRLAGDERPKRRVWSRGAGNVVHRDLPPAVHGSRRRWGGRCGRVDAELVGAAGFGGQFEQGVVRSRRRPPAPSEPWWWPRRRLIWKRSLTV